MGNERRSRIHAALDLLLDALDEREPREDADDLIPVSPDALEPLGLEYRPVVALAQSGTLRTVWIGRRRFTKRSWLVALADALPSATDTAPGDELALAAAKRAARVAR
jgi:hypothetical protein